MGTKKGLSVSLLRPFFIAAVASLLVVIILIVSHRSFKATETTTIAEFNRRQLTMAREAAGGIEFYFETLATAMKAIGKTPEVIQFQEEAIRRILSFTYEELAWLGINDIAVMDSRGRVACTSASHQGEGIHASWRGYLHRTGQRSGDRSYFLDFITFSGNGKEKEKGLLVGVSVNGRSSQGGPQAARSGGIVFCVLKLDTLIDKFLVPVQSSGEGYVFLIEKGFQVLWSPDPTYFGKNLLEEAAGFPAMQRVLQRMNSGVSGTGEFVFRRYDEADRRFTEQRDTTLIAYVPVHLGREQWSLGVWAPKERANKLIRSSYLQQLFLVGLIVLAILIGSLFTIALANRYSRSLEREVQAKVREFRESHQRLLTVFDSLDAWVYVADLQTFEILYINKHMRDLFGEVTGKKCWQVLHKGLSGPCEFCRSIKPERVDDISAEGHVRKLQNAINGRWYEARDRVIRWVDGRVVKLEIAYDITERKQVEDELLRAHHEMGTFCRIIREIGAQQTLDGVGSFLIKELGNILETHDMQLIVLSGEQDVLFTLNGAHTRVIHDFQLVSRTVDLLMGLQGMTTGGAKTVSPPLIPDSYANKGRQTIIPFQVQGQTAGALVVICERDCRCEEKELDLVGLILEQASGAIKRAARHEEEIRALRGQINRKTEFSGIIGKDPKMQMIYKLIEDIAPTDATVLIQGESGTGKELVARAIHVNSPRSDKPFVVINCSAYPTSLLESELFGHEKGAFTGATRRKAGRFEQADGGTVFLDEIGEIPLSAQIKLLRVLQSHKFERVGGEVTLSVDVRILAATNKNLLEEVKAGRFREDLFYRLNVIPVNLPPLRERRNDIPLIARHFQRKFAREQGWKNQDFSSEAMRSLLDYAWPGNVRELENSIEHAVVLSKGKRIDVSHLPTAVCEAQSSLARRSRKTILENEKKLMIEVLTECNWNKTQAAQRLGISRSTLYDKIKKYKIVQHAN